jgi:ribonuclease HI
MIKKSKVKKRKQSRSEIIIGYQLNKHQSPNRERPNKGLAVDASLTKSRITDSIGLGYIKGVDLETGEIAFELEIPGETTNNIAEYLAIHRGLEWCIENKKSPLIYSDSLNAIGWAKKAFCGTKYHSPDSKQRLAILKADRRLKEESFSIYWWENKNWGETPADFGRK